MVRAGGTELSEFEWGGVMTWFYECVGIVVATCWLAGYIIFG